MTLALSTMIILSTFVAVIIKSLGAIFIPLLLWNKTRGIFFAWMKVYISLSLYAPFAIFISILPKESALYASEIANNNLSGSESFISIVVVSIVNFLSILALIKIPGWINQIIGSQNDNDSMGVGTVLKTAVETGSKFSSMVGNTNFAKGAGKMISNMRNFSSRAF